jgi:hypothetical protein
MLQGIASALGRTVRLPPIPEIMADQIALADSGRAPVRRKGLAAPPPPVPAAAKPILQLSKLPITLDPELYKNAQSGSNPGGDLRSAFAFRELVDSIPYFQPNYTPTGASLEDAYGAVIEGARATGPITRSMLDKARRAFSSAERPDLAGDPNAPWRLIEPSPPDWWNTAIPNRFREATLEASGGGSGDYTILGGDHVPELTIGGGTSLPLDPATQFKSVTLKCQTVVLRRSWLDFMIFPRADWGVPEEPAGFLSSGDVRTNDGMLPLIPICILIGSDIVVNAEWGPSDAARLAAAGDKQVAVGPFPVANAPSSLIYLVAVVSYLVPFAPKIVP